MNYEYATKKRKRGVNQNCAEREKRRVLKLSGQINQDIISRR